MERTQCSSSSAAQRLSPSFHHLSVSSEAPPPIASTTAPREYAGVQCVSPHFFPAWLLVLVQSGACKASVDITKERNEFGGSFSWIMILLTLVKDLKVAVLTT